ncbi:unnamed protein product [Rhizophagus irregularis]|nr:unnamed protein product [Rhizophagus irregularis]
MDDVNSSIWNQRSKLFKEWEKSLNITKVKKKFYKRRQRDRTTHCALNEVTRQKHTCTTQSHTPLIPYGRIGGLYDDTAHIKWTSSNFLHSGSWESHRDNIWFDIIDVCHTFNYKFIGNSYFIG